MKKTLIIIPGLEGNDAYFQKQIKFFDDNYDVRIFYLEPSDTQVKEISQKLRNYILKENIQKPIIWGFSFGGTVAINYAGNYFQEISGLILGCTFSAYGFYRRWGGFLMTIFDPIINYLPKRLLIYILHYGGVTLKEWPIYKKLIYSAYTQKPAVYFKRFRSAFYLDQTSLLDKIRCPTFIYAGEKDHLVLPQAAFLLHQKIKNSQLIVFPNTSHLVHITQAEEFNKKLLDFLKTL